MLLVFLFACSTEKLSTINICRAYREGHESFRTFPELRSNLEVLFRNENYIREGTNTCYQQSIFSENQCGNLQELEIIECPTEDELFVMNKAEAYFQGYVSACKKYNNILESINQSVINQPLGECSGYYSNGNDLSDEQFDFGSIDCDSMELVDYPDDPNEVYEIILGDEILRTFSKWSGLDSGEETSIEDVEASVNFFEEYTDATPILEQYSEQCE